jgi:pilus assembly protein Flp/PilA
MPDAGKGGCAGIACKCLRETDMVKFIKLLKNEKGATAIEYGLIAALIAVAAIGAMQGIGNSLNNTFNNVSSHLQ